MPHLVVDRGLLIAPLLVLFQEGAGVGEDSWPAEGLAGAGTDFLAELAFPELAAPGVAFEENLRDHRLADERVGDLEPAGNLLLGHIDILEETGVAKVVDVVVAGLAGVGVALLEADVGPDERVAGGRLADVLEGDFLDWQTPGRLPVNRAVQQQQQRCGERLAKRAKPFRRAVCPTGCRRRFAWLHSQIVCNLSKRSAAHRRSGRCVAWR